MNHKDINPNINNYNNKSRNSNDFGVSNDEILNS